MHCSESKLLPAASRWRAAADHQLKHDAYTSRQAAQNNPQAEHQQPHHAGIARSSAGCVIAAFSLWNELAEK